ncbi:hypothetical protein EJ04DRAFT_515233 [Polyplosphaeria fusca]|uniref:NAD(P)-binding domain-containing protein n=1 Tax=Polyplosphaeria fusca TaxID=682080 RepID=A0A9P4UZR6_9PLEO|nr:hypothetical protein EJ04DRAFT_515233 [Polyplosphaeria fusca]
MNRRLKIHQGDAKSPVDVSKALVSPTNNKVLVDIIHTSIGAYPRFQFSIFQPFPLTDPTICESGMAALFSAIDQLSTEGTTGNRVGQKPLLITISATASRNLWHSLPLPLFTAPLYAWLLSSPQTDKLKMEELLCADGGAHLRSFVIIRPAILTDGVERGIESVRVGWEWGVDDVGRDNMGPGPAKGWTIGRRDLGAWVFKKVLVEGGWEGKCVSLCY